MEDRETEDAETERDIEELVRKGLLKKSQKGSETYYSTTARGKIVVLAHDAADGVLNFAFDHPYLTWFIAGVIGGILIIAAENLLFQ